jgi:hypothetical protein
MKLVACSITEEMWWFDMKDVWLWAITKKGSSVIFRMQLMVPTGPLNLCNPPNPWKWLHSSSDRLLTPLGLCCYLERCLLSIQTSAFSIFSDVRSERLGIERYDEIWFRIFIQAERWWRYFMLYKHIFPDLTTFHGQKLVTQRLFRFPTWDPSL